MSEYIVSARKYRPDTFRSVVGQSALTTTLKNAIIENKLAHAYLFCGPRGVGKTSCARIFAKTVNCTHRTAEGEACNECESCQSYNEQRSYNILELDAASNNTVDDIRNLIEQVRIPPMTGKYRIYIIDEVHMLSTQAFNAFLKTLEEPPSHALFVLATTDKHKVLPTIVSRCQVYDFNRISTTDIADHLSYVAREEGIQAEREALETIAVNADGGMRDALSIFDQVAGFGRGVITYASVIENLSLIDESEYFKMLAFMVGGQVNHLLILIDSLIRKGYSPLTIIGGYTEFLRNVLMSRDPQTLFLVETSESIRERYIKAAKYCKPSQIWNALKIASDYESKYRNTSSKRLALEVALLKMAESNSPLVDKTPPPSPSVPTPSTPTALPSEEAFSASTAPMQAPQSTVPASCAETPPNARELSVREKTTEKPASTGIRSRYSFSLSAESTEASQVQEVEKRKEKYTAKDLLSAWKAYTAGIQNNVNLKQTLEDCLPILQEDGTIEVQVSSNMQEALLEDSEADLMHFLADALRNDSIRIRLKKVLPQQNASIPVYPQQKYAYFNEKTPYFSKFVDELGLTPTS